MPVKEGGHSAGRGELPGGGQGWGTQEEEGLDAPGMVAP